MVALIEYVDLIGMSPQSLITNLALAVGARCISSSHKLAIILCFIH